MHYPVWVKHVVLHLVHLESTLVCWQPAVSVAELALDKTSKRLLKHINSYSRISADSGLVSFCSGNLFLSPLMDFCNVVYWYTGTDVSLSGLLQKKKRTKTWTDNVRNFYWKRLTDWLNTETDWQLWLVSQ